ncbi:hypothetical protein PTSG_02133 [Salpingoeca rosetta]|uniref:J domain-containing protein n=1 Tax=Salpingoeca rosetta (strain ATCC 50818 / BSB-021) TaxID=946362 RepID=F2U1A9_SALR5|nr:uncharacterized protein PTSG_02133 [Salpingoeca rosetta]EGD81411.1 hypothetical protein PTSG_02133 [Salpingoeca rosetta]|eukprot:XP_004996615.1 hypothetical protein PTSG_02133 [Salpingoeca rosetta]
MMRLLVVVVAGLLLVASSLSPGCDASDPRNHYEMLGLARDCARSAVRRAFRQLALKYHPDKNPDPEEQKMFITIAAAYETLNDKALRAQYDAMIGPGGVDPNYMTRRGPSGAPPPSGPAPPPPPPFDYEAFFRKFDDVLREHAETHLNAVKQAGIDPSGVADHLKQHLRDHMKKHQDANRAHAMAVQQANAHHNHGHNHGQRKYEQPREDLLLEGLFDDVDEDEEKVFQQHLATMKSSEAHGKHSKSSRKCTTKVVETDGKVETITECVETTEE